MNRHYQVLPECHADTALIDIIGFKKPNHISGIGEVANTMQKNFKTSPAIGIIDNDKTKPSYFKEFNTQEEKNGLILKKHPDKEHYLIIVDPAVEGWLWNAAKSLNVDPNKYGFKNIKSLKQVTKNQNVGSHQRFKDFVNNIKQKKNSPCNTIINWINKYVNE